MNSGIFPGTENALEAKITKTLSVSAKDDVKVRLKYKLIFFFFRRIGYEGNLLQNFASGPVIIILTKTIVSKSIRWPLGTIYERLRAVRFTVTIFCTPKF